MRTYVISHYAPDYLEKTDDYMTFSKVINLFGLAKKIIEI